MPLEPGSSNETVSKNIKEMVESGHPQKQAVAASLENAGKSNKDGGPGSGPQPGSGSNRFEAGGMSWPTSTKPKPSSKDVETPKPPSGPMSTGGPSGGKVEGLPEAATPSSKANDCGSSMSLDAIKDMGKRIGRY